MKTGSFGVLAAASLLSLFALQVGCAAEVEDEGAPTDVDTGELGTKTLRLPANGTGKFTLKTTSPMAVTLTFDCHPPADPDEMGPVFQVATSSDFQTTSADTPRAGYWSWTGSLAAGSHS